MNISKIKINKKSLTKKIYLDIKKRERLLSLVENLKSTERMSTMMFLNHLFKEYKKKSKEIINEKYGEKSELIDFDNMKKIQTILSSNIVINDEIIYPNEIYK